MALLTLRAAGQDDFRLPGPDGVDGIVDRQHTRGAGAHDRIRGHLLRDSSTKGGIPGRIDISEDCLQCPRSTSSTCSGSSPVRCRAPLYDRNRQIIRIQRFQAAAKEPTAVRQASQLLRPAWFSP